MTENEIRRQTSVIMDAYFALSGTDDAPDIKSFIALRKEAIKELERGTAKKKNGRPVKPHFEDEGASYTDAEPAAAGRSSESAAKKPAGFRKTVKLTEPTAAERKTEEKREAAAGKEQESAGAAKQAQAAEDTGELEPSAFDILRKIRDPWN